MRDFEDNRPFESVADELREMAEYMSLALEWGRIAKAVAIEFANAAAAGEKIDSDELKRLRATYSAIQWTINGQVIAELEQRRFRSFVTEKGHANDRRAAARSAIRAEFDRWQRHEVTYRSDADFGRKMHAIHPEYASDRSIAQRAAKWRKE